MCLTCGCHEALNDHGDPTNLTLPDLQAAADASRVPLDRAARNLVETVEVTLSSDARQAFSEAANRPLILSDIDNTLGRYVEQATAAVNVIANKHYTIAQHTTYHGPFTSDERAWLKAQRHNNPSFFATLAPDTAAIRALGIIHAHGFPVAISSDRPADAAQVSSRWLDDQGVKRDRELFIGRGGKLQILASHGPHLPAILLDDNPAYWQDAARPGVQVWSPRKPWTPISSMYPYVRVFDSWDEPLSWLGLD